MKDPELKLRTDRVYYIHYGDENWGAYQFVEKVSVGEDVFFQCVALEKGFEEQRTVYVPAHFIQKMIEFHSLAEYEQRYGQWQEERDEQKFKNNF